MSFFSRMDSLCLGTSTTANSFSALQFFSQPSIHGIGRSSKILRFPIRKPRNTLVLASKDKPELDEWDRMELKFGRMLGEDPELTMAKIMGRKSNPDLSYLEIEKLFYKRKGRKGKTSSDEIVDIPFDLSDEKKSKISTQGLNLVRPVPRKGVKFEAVNNGRPVNLSDEKKSAISTQGLSLLRPVPNKGIKFEATDKMSKTNGENSTRPEKKSADEVKSSVPNVILRKPSLVNEDVDGANGKKTSRFGMKPNLSLRMGNEMQKERFSDITLLKKPEPMTISNEVNSQSDSSFEIEDEDNVITFNKEREQESSEDLTESNFNAVVTRDEFFTSEIVTFKETSKKDSEVDESSAGGKLRILSLNKLLVPFEELQADMSSGGKTFATDGSSGSINSMPMDSALKQKPKRLDRPSKATSQKVLKNPESFGNPSGLENFIKNSPIKEREEGDWTRAEKMVQTGEREEVELISSSTGGFALPLQVSFGSLTGFLPHRNLGARWKFLAFESWLRRKGLDPSNYRQNLGIIGNYEANSMGDTSELILDPESGPKTAITPDMKLEDLLMIYDQEKLKFISSFIGQKIKVGVVLADRNSQRLILSLKPRENEESAKMKRSLMKIEAEGHIYEIDPVDLNFKLLDLECYSISQARLNVGDVVKCCITKVTYFGIFVEVEGGVPALIHQSEVSWDATLDPSTYFQVGQTVDAKVHQLDFSLERIYLSLKGITPDPLMEALEAVVSDHNSLDDRLEAAQADTEWPDVESLIKELQQFDGIQSVSKGRYFLSPGLAPTFQVYMASLFENQYKLLARAGNRVQEVIVRTSLSKDELRYAIMTCTNRVE
ncbi:S1 RNA-binding domain-containing family protein [Striga asiatica]|uniref:S1 RNA-binding domain-containing family protein n=1 Tax=Striga asiatica TaxID=4170 RepID=A0A5A7Q1Z5_STRAF|nr:S1 RNA-binding domain-containing family protein [Striga asiatica]